jgi:hypothetical protein
MSTQVPDFLVEVPQRSLKYLPVSRIRGGAQIVQNTRAGK